MYSIETMLEDCLLSCLPCGNSLSIYPHISLNNFAPIHILFNKVIFVSIIHNNLFLFYFKRLSNKLVRQPLVIFIHELAMEIFYLQT